MKLDSNSTPVIELRGIKREYRMENKRQNNDDIVVKALRDGELVSDLQVAHIRNAADDLAKWNRDHAAISGGRQ